MAFIIATMLFSFAGSLCVIAAAYNFPTKIIKRDSPYKQWAENAKSHKLTASIKFDQFLSYYKLAPKEWVISKKEAYHKAEDGHHIYIIFSKKDYKKYQAFYKEHTNPKYQGEFALLDQVQEDIETMRKLALQEQEQAVNELNAYVERLKAER